MSKFYQKVTATFHFIVIFLQQGRDIKYHGIWYFC